mmetsp:Transcript_27958/g.71975  ORF Transcript_27958/g.71975 Transcript_27958/m.71975 type:complete len:216 (-) Transcript_27958:503-1150(-)
MVGDVQVPVAVSVVHQRHALARDTGHLARLGHAHRLQDDGVPVQVLELMPEAGQSLHQINGVAQVEVVSVAPEEGVPQLPENKDEVAGLAINERLALFKLVDLLPVHHARLHVDAQKFRLALVLNVGAVLTYLLRVLLEHAGTELPRDHLVLAVALARAGRGLDDILVTRDREHGAHIEVLQADLQLRHHMVALLRACVLLTAAAAKAEAAAKKL